LASLGPRTLSTVNVLGLTTTELLIGLGVMVVAGALQGAIGFGLSVLSVPILTIVNPVYTPVPILVVALIMAAANLARERTALDFEGAGWIIGGRIPGAMAGAWILSVASERTLGIVIGLVVLVAVAILASGAEVALTKTNRLIAGTISGFSGTASGIGGPPIALLYRQQRGPVVRSTLGAIFTIGIAINLVILWVAGVLSTAHVTIAAILLPATFVGFVASGWLRQHVEGARIRFAILGVSAFAALALLATSVTG
jgi:hypothetical protein